LRITDNRCHDKVNKKNLFGYPLRVPVFLKKRLMRIEFGKKVQVFMIYL